MEAITFRFRLWYRFINRLIVRYKTSYKVSDVQYYMRITYHQQRSATEIRYDSMKEIVEHVYYNVPDSPTYTYSLVCRNKDTGKEWVLTLRHNKNLNHQYAL